MAGAAHYHNTPAMAGRSHGWPVKNEPSMQMLYNASGDRAIAQTSAYGHTTANDPYARQVSMSQPLPVTHPTAAQSLSFAWENRVLLLTEFVMHNMTAADLSSLFLLDPKLTDRAVVEIMRITNLPYAALAYTDAMPIPTPMTKSTKESMRLLEWASSVDKSRDEDEQSTGERDRFRMRLMNAISSLYAACEHYNRLVLEGNVPHLPLVAVELFQRSNVAMDIEQKNQLLREIMLTNLLIGNEERFSIAQMLKQAMRLFSEFGVEAKDIRVLIPQEALVSMFTYNGNQLSSTEEDVPVMDQTQVRPGSVEVEAPSGINIKLKYLAIPGINATVMPYKLLRIPDEPRIAFENKLNIGGFARACIDVSKTYLVPGERDIAVLDTTVTGHHTRLLFVDIMGHCGIWEPLPRLTPNLSKLPGGDRGQAIGTYKDKRKESGFIYDASSDRAPIFIQSRYQVKDGGVCNGTFAPYTAMSGLVEEFVKRNLVALLEQYKVQPDAKFEVCYAALLEILLPSTRQKIDNDFNSFLKGIYASAGMRGLAYEFWKALPIDMHLIQHQTAHGFYPPLDFFVLRGSMQFMTNPAFVTCGKIGNMWVSRPRIDNTHSVYDAFYNGRMSVVSGASVIHQKNGLQFPHFFGYVVGGGGCRWMQPFDYKPNVLRNSGDLFSRFVGVCGQTLPLDRSGNTYISLSGQPRDDPYESTRWQENTGTQTCAQAQYFWDRIMQPNWQATLRDPNAISNQDAAPGCFSPMYHHGFTYNKAVGSVVATEVIPDSVLRSNGTPERLGRILMHNSVRM
jgi:hypothetical protein